MEGDDQKNAGNGANKLPGVDSPCLGEPQTWNRKLGEEEPHAGDDDEQVLASCERFLRGPLAKGQELLDWSRHVDSRLPAPDRRSVVVESGYRAELQCGDVSVVGPCISSWAAWTSAICACSSWLWICFDNGVDARFSDDLTLRRAPYRSQSDDRAFVDVLTLIRAAC